MHLKIYLFGIMNIIVYYQEKEYDTLFKKKINVLENNFIEKNKNNKLILQDKKLIKKYIKEFKQFTMILNIIFINNK